VDWRLWFTSLFLAAQVVLPLRYYLGDGDPNDERFAWRMFSDVRLVRCEGAFTEGQKPVRLEQHFHVAWISLLHRGRQNVIRAMAARLCRDAPGVPVSLRLRCRRPDGMVVAVSDGSTDLCRDKP
jgi:hypothetical protein